jgi:hypothetical protein
MAYACCTRWVPDGSQVCWGFERLLPLARHVPVVPLSAAARSGGAGTDHGERLRDLGMDDDDALPSSWCRRARAVSA